MKTFRKLLADWGKPLFRIVFCCIAIDIATEFFLAYNYVAGLRYVVREWQSLCQIAGLWLDGILLLWSCWLLRAPSKRHNLSYALAGIPMSVISLLWFYLCSGASPAVKS